MWVNAEGGGTAGSYYYHLEFANLSGHTCSLAGYPGVSAVNLGGRLLGHSAAREKFGTARTITLAPDQATSALVRVTDVGALPSACRPVLAAGFRVYPPDEKTSKVVPFPFQTCGNPAYGDILVRAVRTESG